MLEGNSPLHFSIEGREVMLNIPERIQKQESYFIFQAKMNPQLAVDILLRGEYVLIGDYFSSGLLVLNQLKTFLSKSKTKETYGEQRDNRAEFRDLSHRILVEINAGVLCVRKAPEIGWLKRFYKEDTSFCLPFPQVQGLNSAWQWYWNGIVIPGLDRRIQPFYGTYFPTRFEHLILFTKWLKAYQGDKSSAYDIGIGSGVLSFQMLQAGFERVIATDSNPNAIIGMHLYLERKKAKTQFRLLYGDLFADSDECSPLIVFNPPWMPAKHDAQGIDKAIFYDNTLFPRFFKEAYVHLAQEGRVVLLFSNLGQVTGEESEHPIEKELLEGQRFVKDDLWILPVKSASKKTKRDQHWRSSEQVELWILKAKSSQ